MICKVSEESYEFQRMKELFPFENEFYILVPDKEDVSGNDAVSNKNPETKEV